MTSKQDLKVSNRLKIHSCVKSIGSGIMRVFETGNGAFGAILLALLTLTAIFAPLIAPYNPLELTASSLAPPSWKHIFGTDDVGHDMFSLVIHGSRSSLSVGIATAIASLVVGGSVGILAGYFRGKTEIVLMRIAELFQTLPAIIIVLFLVAMLGSDFWLLVAAVALAIWPLQARLVYGQYIRLRETEYVAAARIAGLKSGHIIFREILPNAMQPIIVQVALDASIAILIEAALGYLGISDSNMVSWGQMLYTAQNFLSDAWWMSVFPGVAICFAVVGFNMLADGLNEQANPKSASTGRNFHD